MCAGSANKSLSPSQIRYRLFLQFWELGDTKLSLPPKKIGPIKCVQYPSPRSAPCQKYIRGWVLGWTWNVEFPHPFPDFYDGVKVCEIFHRFSTPVEFEVLWFRNETCLKSRSCFGAPMIGHSPPQIWYKLLPQVWEQYFPRKSKNGREKCLDG